MIVRKRRETYVWQEEEALQLMRDSFSGNDLVTIRTLYLALTEVAEEHNGTLETVLIYSGLTHNDYMTGIKALEKIGLIDVETINKDSGDETKRSITVKSMTDNSGLNEIEYIRSNYVNYNEIPNKRPKEAGYVYVLQADKYYKIGKTSNLDRRMREISPKLPFDSKLVCKIKIDDMARLEKALHKKYSEFRTNGEWFILPPEEIEELKRCAYHSQEQEEVVS